MDAITTLQGSAERINNHGDIVGWRTNGTAYRSVRWNDSNPDGELMFGSVNRKATGINDQGEIVGITVDSMGNGIDGYYWNGTDDIGSITYGLGDFYLPIAGINNLSFTAGNVSTQSGFMKVDDVMPTAIGKISPSDAFSSVLGFNEMGLYVGESGAKGFVYDVTTDTLYNSSDFLFQTTGYDSILRITDINNHGVFTGVALVNGVEHGIVGTLVPVPEPSVALLLLAGLPFVAKRLLNSK